jgi:hypothetical protein
MRYNLDMLIFIIILRLCFPFLIFKFPIGATFASVLLDYVDYYFFNVTDPASDVQYQFIDKLLDLVFLTCALLYSQSWKERHVRKALRYLYLFRLAGIVIFTLTGQFLALIIFPNIFESLFVFYLVFQKLYPAKKFFISRPIICVTAVLLIIPRILHEIALHLTSESNPLSILLAGDVSFSQPQIDILWAAIYVVPAIAAISIRNRSFRSK